MTIQVLSQQYAANKSKLEAALNSASIVHFNDPSVFQGSRGAFTDNAIEVGEAFAVVMDHPKRSRFATIKRKADGSFKVS